MRWIMLFFIDMEQYFHNYKTSFRGHKGYFLPKFHFREAKVVWQLNKTINFTNSKAELLCDKIGEAEQS
jgi:hypothetical protein